MKFIIPFVLLFSALALQTPSNPTLAEAQQFMSQAEARLNELNVKQGALPGIRLSGATKSMYVLWIESGGRKIQQDAGDGPEQTMAG
jgi:hypothetical protein